MQLYLKKSPTQVFSCEYCKLFKNSFFYRTPQVTASVLWTITILNYNRALDNLRIMSDGMLYGRRQLLLLSQSGFK